MPPLSLDIAQLTRLCVENGVKRLAVFGSTARGEATPKSDLDLLVEFKEPKSLLALIALERQLSEALGREVDLLTEAALSPYLRESIRQEARVVYEAR